MKHPKNLTMISITVLSLILQSCGGGLPTPGSSSDSSPSTGSDEVIPSFVVFDACNADGCGLWRTDGTASGTTLLKQNDNNFAGPTKFVRWKNKTVFLAVGTAGQYDYQPWITDGTTSGTIRLATVRSAKNIYSLNNNYFLFSADSDDQADPLSGTGYELWISDGTPGGTRLLKEIYTGTTGGDPWGFGKLGSKVYFSAQGDSYGRELWVTDGTAAGTQMVKDIHIGSSPSLGNISEFPIVATSNKLFFQANDGTGGDELWVSGGTEAGTQLVKDINAGGGGSFPDSITPFGNGVIFKADDGSGAELWYSDGTAGGTVMVKDINGSGGSDPRNFKVHLGKLYFQADDGTHGVEMWVSDGTSAGTHIVKDINSGNGSSLQNDDGYYYGYTVLGEKLLFTATDGTNGYELWVTDGSESGTMMLKDLASALDGDPQRFHQVGNYVVFSATDGPDDGTTHGRELWATDGTSANTLMIKDIYEGDESFPFGNFYAD